MTEQGFTTAQIEDKLTKLRIKAEHANTNEHEREALQEKIAEWMQRYSITQARIDAKRLADGDRAGEKVVTGEILFEGTYAKDYVLMGHYALSQLNNIRTYQSKISNSKIYLKIVGFETDVEQAKLLGISLQLQAATAVDAWIRTDSRVRVIWGSLTASEKYKEKRHFISSFGLGAGERIKLSQSKLRAEEEVREPGTEIMLRDRGAVVQNFYDGLGLRSVKTRRQGSYYGGSAGRDAGRRANTGDTGVGGNSQRRLS